MADTHGTDSGVTGMRNYLHIFIKGGLVLFLIAYLTVLYTSDSAKNIPMEQIAQAMEQDSDITSLNKENRSDLKHFIRQMTAISTAISFTKPPPLWQWKKSVL